MADQTRILSLLSLRNFDLDSLTRDALMQVEIEGPLSADELEELLGILARSLNFLFDDSVRGVDHRHEAGDDRGRYVGRASRSTPPTVRLEDSDKQAPESPSL